MPIDYAGAVRALAAMVPPGHVLAYGDVAELLGCGGPRQAGAAMAASGQDEVPWWRIVRADGTLAARLGADAVVHWEAEGTPTDRGRVRMDRARWQPGPDDFARIDTLAAQLPRPNRPGGVV